MRNKNHSVQELPNFEISNSKMGGTSTNIDGKNKKKVPKFQKKKKYERREGKIKKKNPNEQEQPNLKI